MRPITFAMAGFVALLLFPAPAQAQARRHFWGVDGGFSPKWEVPQYFDLFFDADDVTMEGSELRIGFVRGAILGGDWGVSFVKKKVKDGSVVSRSDSTLTMSGASMSGIEIHRFTPFGTIKERVQIGMNFAGGVALMKGTAHQVFVPQSGVSTPAPADVDASTLFRPGGVDIKVVPLLKIELAVAAILAPDLKIKGSGGIGLPGYDKFSISVVYFFGAR